MGTTTRSCVFCGSTGKLTGEHIFGEWLSRIGLGREAVAHAAGRLNRSPREMGVSLPFKSRVRDVCGPCNNGWMSQLETVAARVLTPMVLGNPGIISSADRSAVAAWTHKTALVNMLVSSEEERAQGYGLPATEYRELFELREQRAPLSKTQFWFGHYQGRQLASVCVTPMVVRINGSQEPDTPQAYVMTIVLGKLLLHGARFTTPGLEFGLVPGEGFVQFWPGAEAAVEYQTSAPIDGKSIIRIEKGLKLKTGLPGVAISPWRPATELPPSVQDGLVVQLPTPCGQHFICYPAVLVEEASRGVFYSFASSCKCGKSYLVRTEHDGAHFKAEGPGVEQMYENFAGEELCFHDEEGMFFCKRLRAMED